MFVDIGYAPNRAGRTGLRSLAANRPVIVGAALLSLTLITGLVTASHYGFTVDEFNTDDYGPKALAWYTSGFTDRSHFESVEEFLWYYGPWFQILTGFVQSFAVANPLTVRHATTFVVGVVGLAALIPIARLTVGRWAGPVAIVLCLMTGYLYGSLFFTPIDVPFMAAMNWAVVGILLMAKREIPSWPATIAAGLLTGLAIGTRTGGIITHAYLFGAMLLCGLQAVMRHPGPATRPLLLIGTRTTAAMAIAWATATALWPWLQLGNPFRQFVIAYQHFLSLPLSFDFPHWGERVMTDALPWSYIPAQFLARLPEGFLALLAIGVLFALTTAARFVGSSAARFRQRGFAGLRAPALALARARGILLLIAAVVVPVGFVMIKGATLYDGIRHFLFVIPMLAVLAGGALLRLIPLLRRTPRIGVVVAVAAAVHVGAVAATLVRLHPLEYVAMNGLAGGTTGAAGRFELDYWSAAATEALRQLERRLDADTSARFASEPPRVLVCIGYREAMVDQMFRRKWVLELDPDKADFIIETERWPCAKETKAVLIDEVKRLGASFAGIYANNRGRTD